MLRPQRTPTRGLRARAPKQVKLDAVDFTSSLSHEAHPGSGAMAIDERM